MGATRRPDVLEAAPRTATPVDPADSLYRLARAALTDGDFRRAATLFQQVIDRYPDSEFAPDALAAPSALRGTIRTGAPSTIESCGFRITCSSPCKPDAMATRVPKSVPSDTGNSFTLRVASTVATFTPSGRNSNALPGSVNGAAPAPNAKCTCA